MEDPDPMQHVQLGDGIQPVKSNGAAASASSMIQKTVLLG